MSYPQSIATCLSESPDLKAAREAYAWACMQYFDNRERPVKSMNDHGERLLASERVALIAGEEYHAALRAQEQRGSDEEIVRIMRNVPMGGGYEAAQLAALRAAGYEVRKT